MDDPFAAIHLDNLALTALVGATDDLDLVVFTDGNRTDVVFAAEVGGEGCAH